MFLIPPPHALAGLALLTAALLYLRLTVRWTVAIGRLRRGERGPLADPDYTARPFVSVVVCARNEEQALPCLLAALRTQTYPDAYFEIVVVDDRSRDGTARVVTDEIKRRPAGNLRLVCIDSVPEQWTGKKWALDRGVAESRGQIVATTDADCVPGPQWIALLVAALEADQGWDLVAGPVDYLESSDWTWPRRLLRTEFVALSLASAGSMEEAFPLVATAQNMAWRRMWWERVGGMEAHAGVASGDDVFLLFAAARRGARIGYLFDPRGMVLTRPPRDLASFWRQRVRWASKGVHYPAAQMAVSLLVWGLHAGFCVLAAAALFGAGGLWIFLAGAAGAKMAGDLALLSEAKTFGLRHAALDYLSAWPLHLLYVTLAGLSGVLGRHRWK